jgi:hypothetical protein
MDASTFSRSVDVQYEDGSGLVTVAFKGPGSRADFDAGQEKLRLATEGRTVNAIILDARHSVPAYSPGELADSVERTLDEIAPKRCAFVSTQARAESLTVIEMVSFPFAVRVQAFADMDAARAWVSAAL